MSMTKKTTNGHFDIGVASDVFSLYDFNANFEKGDALIETILTAVDKKLNKGFKCVANTTGNTTINVDLSKYSMLNIMIIPHGNVYNAMSITVSTQMLKDREYMNLGTMVAWGENTNTYAYCKIGFSNSGSITLEGCSLKGLVNGEIATTMDLLITSALSVYAM